MMRGLAGAGADGLGRVRPAGRERRHPEPDAIPRSGPREHRADEGAVRRLGRRLRLGPARSRPAIRTTTAGRSGSSSSSTRRASRTARKARRQLVPEGPDRAGQRAGGRRRVRALRHAGRTCASWSSGSSRSPTYAEQLLDDLTLLDDWPEKVRVMQHNWIGRSEGASIGSRARTEPSRSRSSPRAPTRSSARRSSSLPPEHPAVARLSAPGRCRGPRSRRGADEARPRDRAIDSRSRREKEGVFTGVYADPSADRRAASRCGSPTTS